MAEDAEIVLIAIARRATAGCVRFLNSCSGLSARGIPLTERSLQQLLENSLLSVGYWIAGNARVKFFVDNYLDYND